LDLGGYFFEPTILVGVTADMRIMKEEIFGPVLPIIAVKDEEEALARANKSSLGLGASVWTPDVVRGQKLARRLQAGLVWVNGSIYSHACPDVPWGGVKDSGPGITHSAYGLRNFVNVKHISVDSQHAQDWEYPYSPEKSELIDASLQIGHGQGLGSKLKAAVNAARNFFKMPR
jgi:succinate-semialdehyde dehydrogenase/glutarate-semialdehyde dehydrogenase